MRIVYIGAERVGLACLQKLSTMGKNVIEIFTADESLRPRIADFVTFPAYARRIVSSRDPAFVEEVRALHPDLVVVISWSQIIPPELLAIPPLGCIGIHTSLLPERRGGAPLNWALIDGLTRSGITLLYLDKGIDTGDIIAQKPFDISFSDTTRSLLDRVRVLSVEIIAENIDLIEAGTAPRIPQDHSRATCTRRRTPADSEIDWSTSEVELYNFIRALAPPYPPAFTVLGSRRLVIPLAWFSDGKLRLEGYLE